MPSGQSTWETQGTGTKDFVVEFETAKNMQYEYRHRSAFGPLSRPMKTMTAPGYPEQRPIDIGRSACIWSKEIPAGDEVRFTLRQNMRGAPTYGDAPIIVGEYLAYLHADLILNSTHTPAIPLQEEMSQQRIKRVIADEESGVREEITQYLHEEYVYEIIEGFLMGASRNLRTATAQGGRGLDLDRGAGVQVSPQHFIVAGSGFVSGTSGTEAFETAINTAAAGLTDTAAHKFSRAFAHNLRYAVTEKKCAQVSLDGGKPKWYCPCDPHLLAGITDPSGQLHQDWQQAGARSPENPVFGHTAVELDDMVFFPEERLKQFRWVDSSGSNVWGADVPDRRDLSVSSNVALMFVLGNGAILDGHTGQVRVTHDEGFHGQSKTIAAHVKQSFMRTRWIPKDGRSGVTIEQGGMVCAFYTGGLVL